MLARGVAQALQELALRAGAEDGYLGRGYQGGDIRNTRDKLLSFGALLSLPYWTQVRTPLFEIIDTIDQQQKYFSTKS